MVIVVVYVMQDKNMERINKNEFVKYLEEFYSKLPKPYPNLIIGIEELTQLSFKYGKTNKEFIEIIQRILRKEFEKGNLYGRIRFIDVKKYIDEEIL